MTKRRKRRRGGGEKPRGTHTHTGSALYRCLPSCSIVHVVLIFFFIQFSTSFLALFFFVLTFPTSFFRMTSSHCKTTQKEKRKSRGTNCGREVSWLSHTHTHTLCACALIAHQRF